MEQVLIKRMTALTPIGMEVATPANNSNNTEVATLTAWVRTYETC